MKTGKIFDNLEYKYYSNLGGDVFDGNGGRAGLKRSNLQGGICVPLIVHWTDKINKKRTSKRLIANYDILPTIADIIGYSNPLDLDGISFFNELVDNEDREEHEFVIYSSFTGPALITKDGWKLRTYLDKNAFELYYLPNDFREEYNLTKIYPEKADMFKEYMKENKVKYKDKKGVVELIKHLETN